MLGNAAMAGGGMLGRAAAAGGGMLGSAAFVGGGMLGRAALAVQAEAISTAIRVIFSNSSEKQRMRRSLLAAKGRVEMYASERLPPDWVEMLQQKHYNETFPSWVTCFSYPFSN